MGPTRPLTVDETNWLRANAVLPSIFLVILMLIVLGTAALVVVPMRDRPFVAAFGMAGAVMIIALAAGIAFHVRNNLGDARDGVAQVRSGSLTARRETGRAPKTCYATFDGVGEVILMHDIWADLEDGISYRVAFSPRTRKGWDVEPDRG